MTCSIIGRCRIGSICFGVVLVSGRSRVPNPPTRTTAWVTSLIRPSSSSSVGGCGRRPAGRCGGGRGRVALGRHRRGRVERLALRRRVLAVALAERLQLARRARRLDRAALRNERQGHGHVVAVEVDVADVARDDAVGLRRRRLHRLLPHRELYLAGLAVTGGLTLLVDLAIRHLDGGVGDLHACLVEEAGHLGTVAGGSRGERVDVDEAVLVGVDAEDVVAGVGDRRLLLAADVDGERRVPVVGRLTGGQLGPGRGVVRSGGLVRGPRVDHDAEADDDDGDDRGGEEPGALLVRLLAAAAAAGRDARHSAR